MAKYKQSCLIVQLIVVNCNLLVYESKFSTSATLCKHLESFTMPNLRKRESTIDFNGNLGCWNLHRYLKTLFFSKRMLLNLLSECRKECLKITPVIPFRYSYFSLQVLPRGVQTFVAISILLPVYRVQTTSLVSWHQSILPVQNYPLSRRDRGRFAVKLNTWALNTHSPR